MTTPQRQTAATRRARAALAQHFAEVKRRAAKRAALGQHFSELREQAERRAKILMDFAEERLPAVTYHRSESEIYDDLVKALTKEYRERLRLHLGW